MESAVVTTRARPNRLWIVCSPPFSEARLADAGGGFKVGMAGSGGDELPVFGRHNRAAFFGKVFIEEAECVRGLDDPDAGAVL